MSETKGLYTVVAYDEKGQRVASVRNVIAFTRREAYYSVMGQIVNHNTFDAWRNTDDIPEGTAPLFVFGKREENA